MAPVALWKMLFVHTLDILLFSFLYAPHRLSVCCGHQNNITSQLRPSVIALPVSTLDSLQVSRWFKSKFHSVSLPQRKEKTQAGELFQQAARPAVCSPSNFNFYFLFLWLLHQRGYLNWGGESCSSGRARHPESRREDCPRSFTLNFLNHKRETSRLQCHLAGFKTELLAKSWGFWSLPGKSRPVSLTPLSRALLAVI